MYVVHRTSDARSHLLSVFERADTVEPCCAIAEHGFVEVVCWLVFWNFNEFFKIIIIYHMNHFSVKMRKRLFLSYDVILFLVNYST